MHAVSPNLHILARYAATFAYALFLMARLGWFYVETFLRAAKLGQSRRIAAGGARDGDSGGSGAP